MVVVEVEVDKLVLALRGATMLVVAEVGGAGVGVGWASAERLLLNACSSVESRVFSSFVARSSSLVKRSSCWSLTFSWSMTVRWSLRTLFSSIITG